MHPPSAPPSPTSPSQTDQQLPTGNLDFDNLMQKQRELLKEIRSSPDKKKDILSIHLPYSSVADSAAAVEGQNQTTPPTEWGWSFERVSTNGNNRSTVEEDAAASSKKTKKQRKHERHQAEEWISDWNFERITTTSAIKHSADAAESPAAAAAAPFNGHDSASSETQEWYFERIPTMSRAKSPTGNDGGDSVMEMVMMDEREDEEFAALEAAVSNADDISLEDLVVDGDGDDSDDDDDVMMSIDDDEGLLPREPQYMQELKTRQTNTAYIHEIKQRQEMPPPPSVITPLTAERSSAMDEDGDTSMMGPKQDRSMSTPDTSDHTPKRSDEKFGTGSSPTSIMDGPQVPSLTRGFPRPANISASSSFSSASLQLPCAEGMDDLFTNTLQKLTQSMQRTAESRRSLKIKTEQTQEYERNLCVHQILQSVESSSRQVDTCLQMYRPGQGTPHAASS